MTDTETLAVYDAQAEEYAALTDAHDNPCLTAFLEMLPPKARVLDLGCGPGASAELMARAGCIVTATDASSEMVRLAAQRPGVTAHQATFDQITGTDCYDAIWANFSLLHAKRSALPDHLTALRTALVPGGVFFIGMKTGTGGKRDPIGRHYEYYSHDALNSLLSDAGFTPGTHWAGEDKGLDGVMAKWVAILADG